MKAGLEICYDNDMINRDFSEEQAKKKIEEIIAPHRKYLPAIEDFLSKLKKKEFTTVCIGDMDAGQKILKNAPEMTEELLCYIFDGV